MKQLIDLETVKARHEAAHCEIHRLCQGKTTWMMSIPIREDDTDVVLTNSLHDIPTLAAEVEQLRAMIGEQRYYTAETMEAIVAKRDELKAEARIESGS